MTSTKSSTKSKNTLNSSKKGLTRSRSLECVAELHELINQREQDSSNDTVDILHHFKWLLDDKFLLHFARGCKYSSDKAFTKLNNYLKQRVKHADIIQKMIPSKMHEVCKVLKHRGPEGQLIVVQKPCDWGTTSEAAEHYFISAMGNHEVVWEDELTQRNGVIGIWDGTGFGIAHAKPFGPRFLSIVLQLSFLAFPLRLKALHIVNAPTYFIAFYYAIKYLLTSKFRDRLVIHGNNLDSLYSMVPPEKLPVFVGGLAPDDEACRDDIFPAILAKENYYKKFSKTLQNILDLEKQYSLTQ